MFEWQEARRCREKTTTQDVERWWSGPVLCNPYLTHALEGRGKQRGILTRGGLEEADSLLRASKGASGPF